MPIASKRRPDTLELEVLRTSEATKYEKSWRDGQSKRKRITETTKRSALTDNVLEPLQCDNDDDDHHHHYDKIQRQRSSHWYQFGNKFLRRCNLIGGDNANSNQTSKSKSFDEVSDFNTAKINVNMGTATLAKPEGTIIGNSTSTILTTTPPQQQQQEEQQPAPPPLSPLALSQNSCIPDVVTILPRTNSKKRRRSKTDNLYNLNNIDQADDIEQLSPVQCTSVAIPNVQTIPISIAKIPVTVSVPIPSSSSSYSYDQTLLTAMEQQKSIPLPKPSIKLKQQQDIETNVPLVKSDIKVNFLSFLSRLTHWKANNCQCNHKHIAKHPYKATNINVGDDINPDDNCNTIDSTSLETQKSINLSNEFHVLPSHANENECMISLANVKEKGIRRLSQIRRRRSSFYYSENERRIRANDREFNGQFKYADNYIKTSKYTLITFLPLNLLEQFQRLANFYFLCLLVLQLIPAISSLTPVTTAIPLIGVLTLTAVKDAYDDIQRHVSDSQVNNRKSKALRNGKLVEEKWSDVQVGDVIHLENNQFVAADILLLSTSEPNGLCFIETAELDGETNLKCKQCLTETNSLGQRQDSLWHFNGEIVCEKPNNLLNKFEGTLTWHNKRYALDNEKILLRGCVLRNTQWCYGMVIFAGKDTKLMQNSGKTQFKSTGVDRLLNFIIIGIVLFLLSICAFFTIACAIWEGIIGQYFQVYLPWEHIIPKTVSQGAPIIGFLVFFSYAIVLNTVVPISLYVSVEVIRFVQSFLINWDEEMYYEPSKTHAKARTTTLNEELGQIQYIFSDKTGTLTQNIMTFNKCSINGHTYGDIIDATGIIQTETDHHVEPIDFSSNPEYEPDFRWFDKTLLEAVLSGEKQTHKFFRLLSLCHTVMPEYVNERLEYQAQSPDEAALVSAARNFGFVFRSRTPNSITIEVMGHKEDYTLLHILDFNNVRKRMSVILRRNNQIVLYCKGADSVIYDRLSSSQTDIEARTQEHLNKFASEGLRTLVLAERYLSLDFYEDWSSRHYEASTSLNDREKKLNDLYEEVESDLLLIGVTAIEDKLQDGVPETIANLQMAGIKIWVLTGDKQETAINIGYSCQLLTDDLADVFIVDGTTKDEVDKQLKQFKESVRIVNRFKPNLINTNANHNANGTYSDSSIEQQQQQQLQQISSPPAVSVVTFRWADDDTKSRGEPYSAETNELYDNMEKADGKKGRGATNHGTAGSYSINKSLASMDADVEEMQPGFAIVINGHSLVHCLSTELEARFLSIASKCKAVICCRVTPLQKALVVELIKRAKSAVTLAIGDGANDVSMIKAAHIGVGISGQEGLQAVLASDYSIAQFRYLERLLLVHGRWSYYRMCKFLRYFFYKNFAFTLCHCWYSMFCGFSAQTVFDPMFISVYNLFYTSLPVLALGVFEQDVSDKHSLEFPKLYTPGLKSQLFNIREFVYSVLHGAFSSLILFLIPYGTYHKGVSPNGLILSDHMTLGAVVATILIIDNTAQIALYTSYWTVFNHITIWGSLIWYFVLDYFYNYVVGGPYVGSLSMAMKDLTFWATMIITVVVIMLPVLAYKFYLADKHPSLADKIRMKRRMASIKLRQTSNVMRAPSARRSGRSLRSGYAFAHQEGFGRLITSGKIMGKLPQEFAFPLSLGGKKNQNSGSGNGSANQLQDNKGSNNNLNNIKLHSNFNHSDINLNRRNYDGPSFSNSTSTRNDNMFNLRAPYQGLDTINL